MLRPKPKRKERRKIPISSDLRDALAEVHFLIGEAKRDPHVNLDFDDAIQVGGLCGGRYQRRPARFEFSWHRESDQGAGRWYLDLFEFEIEDIADGRLTELPLYCCLTSECGAKFTKADGHCDCDYVDDPNFGTFEFPAAADLLRRWGVAGISDTSSKDDVLAVLGPPGETGGDIKTDVGYVGPWIWYRRDDYQINFEFGKNKRLKRVSVMEKDWEPGK